MVLAHMRLDEEPRRRPGGRHHHRLPVEHADIRRGKKDVAQVGAEAERRIGAHVIHIVALDALGGISCGYKDSRVEDRNGRPHRNIYAVGSPTKGTHFFAGAVDINMHRTESVIDSILGDAEKIIRPAELAEALT